MEKLIYRNELNQEIEFSSFSPYILVGVQESVKNNIVSAKQTAQDGEIFASSTLDSRDIKVKGSIIIRSNIDYLKKKFTSTFNPKLKAKLIHYKGNHVREISVLLDEVPQLKENRGTVDFTIDFVALDPYWREIEKTEYLALLSGKLQFPLVIPASQGMMFGMRQSILETKIKNIGDVESGFRVIFKARGEVKNPQVENKYTGQKIKVLVTMQKGDIVEIINQPSRKTVLYNGEKAFKKLDISNSDFFNLEVGDNLLGYNAELNAVNLEVILYYSPLFLGR